MSLFLRISKFSVVSMVLALVMSTPLMAKKEVMTLGPEGQKLLSEYQATLSALRNELKAQAPKLDSAKREKLVAMHQAVKDIPQLIKPPKVKIGPVTYAPGNPVYVGAQGNAILAARDVLKEGDSLLKDTSLDKKLAKVALLASGAEAMAMFAQEGKEQKSHVDFLLADDDLIVEVMALGGAYQSKYGQSIRNYRAILAATENADEDFFRLWALASSLEHPDGNHVPKGKTAPEAIVEFFKSYEKAYAKGELDPAFSTLSPWNRRFIFPFIAVSEVEWMRKMIRNYRPDHMRLDHKWRYCRITKTDVPYTSNVPRPVRPDLGISRMQDFFLEGGICGPRAFTGRAATHAFGIPSRPAPQTGHAAMSRWTPDGWVTVFGAHWTHNRFRGQCGLDFELESRSRMKDDLYQAVHRANWWGDVFEEQGVNRMSFGVGGGFWKSLAFYKKLIIVEDAELEEQETVGAEFAESNEPAVSPVSNWSEEDGSEEDNVQAFPQIELREKDKTIVFADDGTITIPVGASYNAETNEKIKFMRSVDDEFVQVHYALGKSRPHLLKYKVEVPEDGTYEVTSTVSTVTVDRSYLLRVNRRNLFRVNLPLTLGDWQQTEPVKIELKKGKNTILFTADSNNKGITLKEFILKPTS